MTSLAEWDDRLGQLDQAHWNTAALPTHVIPVDLSTNTRAAASVQLRAPLSNLDEAVEAVLGFSITIPSHLGRGAEAILADLVFPGSLVLANEVYTTGAWMIHRRGGQVVELPSEGSYTGDIDLSALRALLEREAVAWVHITLPRVRLGSMGGGFVTLSNLKGVRKLIDHVSPSVPLVLDASRIWENAVRLPASEASGSVSADVLAICALADIIVLSGRKDAGGAHAGLAATRDPVLAQRLKQACLLLEGEHKTGGTSVLERKQLAQGLRAAHSDAKRQWKELERTAHQLTAAGIPLMGWGAGSLYLDARLWLPIVPDTQYPAQTLAALMFLHAGIKGLARAVSEPGPAIVRLAAHCPISPYLLRSLPSLFACAREQRSGLRCVGGPAKGPFTEALEPVTESDWTTGCPLSTATPPGEHVTETGHTIRAMSDIRSELHNLLDLPDDWTLLLAARERGPQSLLVEAWTRMGGTVATTNPLLHGLAEFWASGRKVIDGECLHMAHADELDQVLTSLRPMDSVAANIGTQTELSYHSTSEAHRWWRRARAWWYCTPEGGLLALKRDDPLVKTIRDASLFFAGDFHDGGLSWATCLKLSNRVGLALIECHASREVEEDPRNGGKWHR